MTTLAHRAPVLQPVIVQINVDITGPFWLAWFAVWAAVGFMRDLGGLGRVVIVAPILAYLRGWLADLSLMAEAARLLFYKDVSYGTIQA